MNCSTCGAPLDPQAKFCTACGSPVLRAPQAPQPAPGYVNNIHVTLDSVPQQYRPLSPWAYFGLNLLFAIPIVGFVFLIVYSFSDANINRRNYARSFWCMLLIGAIIGAIVLVILLLTGVIGSSMSRGYYY